MVPNWRNVSIVSKIVATSKSTNCSIDVSSWKSYIELIFFLKLLWHFIFCYWSKSNNSVSFSLDQEIWLVRTWWDYLWKVFSCQWKPHPSGKNFVIILEKYLWKLFSFQWKTNPYGKNFVKSFFIPVKSPSLWLVTWRRLLQLVLRPPFAISLTTFTPRFHAMVKTNTSFENFQTLNTQISQGWAGMTFEGSGTGTGRENSIPKVWEREGNWKFHSQNSGIRD